MTPITAFRLYRIFSGDLSKAKQGVVMDQTTKPGWKTTEFWLTILTQIPTVLGLIMGASNPITIGIGAAATIAYTLCRAWNKSNAQAVAMAALQAGAKAAEDLPSAPDPQGGPIEPQPAPKS